MTETDFVEAVRMIKEGYKEVIEQAYREGFTSGFGVGLSAGHPMAGRCNDEQEENDAWEDSNVKENHVDPVVTGEG